MLSDLLQRLRGLASRKAHATKMTRAKIIIEREGTAPLEIEMENPNLYETHNHSGELIDIEGVRRLVPRGTWTISITGDRTSFSRKPSKRASCVAAEGTVRIA
jgi:hypothetical protein